MTIDKTIEFFNGLECCTPQAKDARYVAIDTMQKYQKIEQAYKKYLNDMVTNIYADGKFIKALREVLEDATN